MPVLSVKKLRTSEDDGIHQELARLDASDVYARDIVLAGAFPDRAEPWDRIYDAIETLSNVKPADIDEAADECERAALVEQGYQSAYYLGIAVGLRLAAVAGTCRADRRPDRLDQRSPVSNDRRNSTAPHRRMGEEGNPL